MLCPRRTGRRTYARQARAAQVFSLAALRYKGGFSFLTMPSTGFPELEFHHRTLVALDEAGTTEWPDSGKTSPARALQHLLF